MRTRVMRRAWLALAIAAATALTLAAPAAAASAQRVTAGPLSAVTAAPWHLAFRQQRGAGLDEVGSITSKDGSFHVVGGSTVAGPDSRAAVGGRPEIWDPDVIGVWRCG